MKTNLLQKPLLYPNRMGGKPIGFTGANPLLKNQERFDEVELEKNLNTKEGQIAFLQYHLEKAKGSQGFIARGFNKLKSWTGLGLSSKKLDEEIAAFMAGQVPFEKVCQDINKFKYNQKEATEILVDGVGAAISFTAAHAFTNFFNIGTALVPLFKKIPKVSIKSSALNFLSGMMIGSGFKSITKFIDSFGMEKSQRKENRHFFRDVLTGGIAGASGALPGMVGTQGLPMIGSVAGGIALNSGVRYLSLDKEDKSFSDFLHQQIENPGIKLFTTAGLVTLAACNYKNLKGWKEVNTKLQKPIENAKTYEARQYETSFEKLAGEKGLNVFDENQEKSLGAILQQCQDKSAQETLAAIEGVNMFYPKYLQTLPSSFAYTEIGKKYPNIGKVIELVKSECTGARTKSDAQKHIDELFGQGEYTIVDPKDKDGKTVEAKPLGVGSVAETWVVKDKDDKEYVIKMVKKDVSKVKLKEQKEYLEKQLNHISDVQEKEAQLRQLNQLFETWEKELDLKAEAEAAISLANSVKNVKVVKPVKTSTDGTAYIMEKAEGELFSNVLNFARLEKELYISTAFDYNKKDDAIKLAYLMLQMEQVFSVPKSGEKVMHADPHPGNIFVDYKDGKAQYTLIDTGNVIHMSSEVAVRNMFNHLSYYLGNTEVIAELLLKNAKYPKEITETQAKKELKEYLDEKIYNDKTKINANDNIYMLVDTLALDWMTTKGIISDPNQANLHKAEYTYSTNLKALNSPNVLNKISNVIHNINRIAKTSDETDKKKAQEKFIKEVSLSQEQKNQLSAIYMEEYDRCIKKIKNLQKLVDKKSYFEGSKSEILYKTYITTLKAIKAISICDSDTYKISKLLKDLNELTKETFEEIKTYNESISDADQKACAQKYFETYNTIFGNILKKDISSIEFTCSNPDDPKKMNKNLYTDTLTDENQKKNAFILNYYFALNPTSYDDREDDGSEDDKVKLNDSEIKEQISNLRNNKAVSNIVDKLKQNYKAKNLKQEDDAAAELAKKIENPKQMISSACKSSSGVLEVLGSCPLHHPFSSIHEFRQMKQYLDKNKEHALTTLRLTIPMLEEFAILNDAIEKEKKEEAKKKGSGNGGNK